MRKFLFFNIILFLPFFLASCSSNSKVARKKPNFELQMKNPAAKNYTPPYIFFETENIGAKTRIFLNADRKEVVNYALKFKGKSRVRPSKKFRNDCSGFVRSVYDKFNIELFNTKNVKSGNKWYSGTRVIYNFVKENGKIFKNKLPKKGDLIFFDNTNDRNKDGKVNDYFTHIAIVIDVKDDGTIYYIHKSGRGINIQKMNLKYKNKVYIKKGDKRIKVNSFLRKRRRKDAKNTPYLSSQMFRAFGTLFNDDRLLSSKK